jgi:hypothetical protein
MITIKSNLKDKSKVAFFEIHKDHPGGEVLVTGEGEFQVARTRQVVWAIGKDKIVEVGKTKEESLAVGTDEGEPLDAATADEGKALDEGKSEMTSARTAPPPPQAKRPFKG